MATGPMQVCVSVAVSLGLLLTACGGNSACDDGEVVARRAANGLAATFTKVLEGSSTEAGAVSGLRAAIDARKTAHYDSESKWFVLGASSLPGRAEVTVAIYAHGEGTLEGSPNGQATVLLCVKVSGAPASSSPAALTVVTCPSNLPPDAPRVVHRSVQPEP
ncbi:MAG: hypothetical protein QG622_439 [Actinomycetota bacterium]|nr:hypothetical protein [Actinomycetota bacterium]